VSNILRIFTLGAGISCAGVVGAGAAYGQAGPAPAEIAAAAAGADVVILGEVHDNPAHHATQAEVAAMLAPTAFVFEMIDTEDAARITPASAADPDALAQTLSWDETGWPDFAFYAPLFQQAAATAVYGAEVDRTAAQAVFSSSAAEVFGDAADRFGLTTPLAEAEQAAREAEQLAAHCDALPTEILPAFVEAQRLRDAALAEQVIDAITATGGPVVVITGNGHARRDWGVPAVLATVAPELQVFSLGQLEGDLPDSAPFDMMVTAAPVERPDPCAAFR